MARFEKGKQPPIGRMFNAERAREAAQRSIEVRRDNREKRKTIRMAVEELLAREYEDGKGNKQTGTTIIAMQLARKAMKGDLQSITNVLRLLGEFDSKQQVELTGCAIQILTSGANKDALDKIK